MYQDNSPLLFVGLLMTVAVALVAWRLGRIQKILEKTLKQQKSEQPPSDSTDM